MHSILTKVEKGELPGRDIPLVMLLYALTDIDGITVNYPHRKILEMPINFLHKGKRLDELDADEKLELLTKILDEIVVVLRQIEGNTRPPGRNGGGDGDAPC